MKWLVGLAMALWLFVMVPVWVVGVGFAGRMKWLPGDDLGWFERLIWIAAMYGPPLGLVWFLLARRRARTQKEDRNFNA